MRGSDLHLPSMLCMALLLAACGGGGGSGDGSTPPDDTRPVTVACPSAVPASARCIAGQDALGAYYLIAVPKDWSGGLILHAHGGPSLSDPSADRPAEDLTRWAIMVKAGYAWAGSSFRQGGVEVRAAAEDTEALRKIFSTYVGKPRRTILHGQSWGAGVAVKAAEMFTAETPYDAVLLTSGVLAGGTRSYDFRLDLRVVYQYLCNNHPRPNEPSYALNLGLPAGTTMTRANLTARTSECLGLDKTTAQRSTEQRRKIDIIERVIRIPERSIQSHLEWATFHFQDISSYRTAGASPFGNIGAQYSGSDNDAALNANVPRYRADPLAVQRLAEDSDPTGQIPVPVLTVKWIDDPTAFVEQDAYFKGVMERAGTADHLVQTFTTSGTHSYISDPTYPALVASLLDWVEIGVKPTPTRVSQRCQTLQAQFGSGCAFAPSYSPAALETRVPVRERP